MTILKRKKEIRVKQSSICDNCHCFVPVKVTYGTKINETVQIMCNHHINGSCHVKGFMPKD